MFEDIHGISARQVQGLKQPPTTDRQAKVLLFNVAEPHYIAGAVLNKQDIKTHYEMIPSG